MCFVIWTLLTDRPADATWLSAEQRDWLVERLESERAQREVVRKYSLVDALISPKIWLLTATGFCLNIGAYALAFFMPLIVKGLGVGTDWIGLVSAVPYLCAFFGMIAWGYHSDLTGERVWHVGGALLLCAAALGVCILIGADHPVVTMLALCVATTCVMSSAPVFWSLPSAMLTGTAAAGGLALINSVANLGGWLGPTVYGLVKDATGSTDLGLLALAAGPVIGACAVLIAGHDRRLERMMTRA
jgi:predicted MFS family arabinose efflux permease